MRIITGQNRGVKLISPTSNNIRPTTSRVKKSMFDILSNKINWSSCMCLDLFSGSAALGIEVLSRGGQCIFVDKDTFLVKKNLKKANFNCKILTMDYLKAIKLLSKTQTKFDLIFLDPPYNFLNKISIIENIIRFEILKNLGYIVLEHRKNEKLNIPDYFSEDNRNYGNIQLSILRSRNG